MRAQPPSSRSLPHPRRRFGQNFLASPAAARRIVDALAPLPGEAVLEIGPGRGAITAPLIERAGRIAAIEIDRDLAAELRATIDPSRLVLIERDVLDVTADEVLRALGLAAPARLVLAGNLPYNISKPVALRLVGERALIERAVLTFQKEVALRLTSGPGSRSYGPLAILVGQAFRVERLFDLPPSAFRPRPAVISTVTRWTPRPAPGLDPAIEPALRACLAASFAHRRRTLLANLRAALPGGSDQAIAILRRADIDPGARAESLPSEAFVALARLWPAARGD